jgi:hypothetical protein
VGPGWFVALWSPRDIQQAPSTLYVVDPLGGRYRVVSFPAPALYQLLDWSGDGRRALVVTPGTGFPVGSLQPPQVEDIDLSTGDVRHHFSEPHPGYVGYQYTRPHGLALLAVSGTTPGGPASLKRLNLAGSLELSYPASFPAVGTVSQSLFGTGVLPTLDGTELVLETTHGMALIANDGAFIKALGPPGQAFCAPQRWWTAVDLIATCQPTGPGELSLWLVSTGSAPPVQLTKPKPPDLGDTNGWEIGSAVYAQALGPCGTVFLARRQPNGSTVPALDGDDVRVIGANGPNLALEGKLGCGPGQSLFSFDTATGTQRPLLGPPLDGGYVLAASSYPGLEP